MSEAVGPISENDLDVQLLRNDPQGLIARYQRVFQVTAKEYVTSGMLLPSDFDDVVQQMNLQILRSIGTIRKNYDGRARLRTYVARLASNVCLKYHRDQPDRRRQVPIASLDASLPGQSTLTPVLIVEARDLFRAMIRMFASRQHRVMLFLKLYYRITIEHDDVRAAYPQAPSEHVEEFVGSFSREDFADEPFADILGRAAPLLNRLEGTSTSAESYRRWTDEKLTELCDALNGNPPSSSFDRQSLRILVEDYCHPFLLHRG